MDPRYDRQVGLPGFGPVVQSRLGAATVLVIGAGGLAAALLTYLAAAGVGRLRLVDDDLVDATNLARQVLYGPHDCGQPKVTVAADRLARLNPDVVVEAIAARATAETLPGLLRGVDVVADCSDNLATRTAVNRACLTAGCADVWATIGAWSGRCAVVAPGAGPCFECVFGQMDDAASPEPAPVFGPVAGLTGALQAGEVIKVIGGVGQPLIGRLALVDARNAELTTTAVVRDPACPACGGVH